MLKRAWAFDIPNLLLTRTRFSLLVRRQYLQNPSLIYSLFICHYEADEYLFRTQFFNSAQCTMCVTFMRKVAMHLSCIWYLQEINHWYTVDWRHLFVCLLIYPSIYLSIHPYTVSTHLSTYSTSENLNCISKEIFQIDQNHWVTELEIKQHKLLWFESVVQDIKPSPWLKSPQA